MAQQMGRIAGQRGACEASSGSPLAPSFSNESGGKKQITADLQAIGQQGMAGRIAQRSPFITCTAPHQEDLPASHSLPRPRRT
jgi:hypothetical protein